MMEPFDPEKNPSQLEFKASPSPSQSVAAPPKSDSASAPVALSVQAIRSLQTHDTFSPTKDGLTVEAGLLSLCATPIALYLLSGDFVAALLWGLAAGVAGLVFCGIALPITHGLLNLFRAKEVERYQLSEELLAYGATSATLAAALYGPLHAPRVACVLLVVSALFAANEVKNFRQAARVDFAGYTPLRLPRPILAAVKGIPGPIDGEVEGLLDQALRDFRHLRDTAYEAEPDRPGSLRQVAEVAQPALLAIIQRAALVSRLLQHVKDGASEAESQQAATEALAELRARAKSLQEITGVTLRLAAQADPAHSSEALQEQADKLRHLTEAQAEVRALLDR